MYERCNAPMVFYNVQILDMMYWYEMVQTRKAGPADGVSKETEDAEELLLLNKPLAQFISPLTQLVSTFHVS